ncbi:putative F-BAR domain only protein 2 isoform X9 [Apostichopus japonicus]|uniref:Putative F-BAR domain only protein 2 isoform X9 n=1 Tax=Stichopus japonicus TaxID=307972 RepID=A0A2G8LKV5_STIJA|nr:putative F-BAR domain only protein 2 isoform X9 [Apostichopus japonicus]
MIAIITVNLPLLCLTPEISNDRGGPSQEVKRIIKSYAGAVHECQQNIDLVHIEFNEQCEELSELKLLEMFAEAKGTGKEQPAVIEFEECDLSNLPVTEPEKPKRKKIRKPKKKGGKEKDGSSPGDSPDMLSPERSGSASSHSLSSFKDTAVVGPYDWKAQALTTELALLTKLVTLLKKLRPASLTVPFTPPSFPLGLDSDSDVEVDRTRKIHVEIKPATIPQDGTKVIAASVDDIKASLSGLALSPRG